MGDKWTHIGLPTKDNCFLEKIYNLKIKQRCLEKWKSMFSFTTTVQVGISYLNSLIDF